ncbi:protein PLASTID MOVEMENT IMPAIRED 1-like [Phalaenopsis equestris]|uniref:protein PLASTID MOVEMENT IMPAIRED 1-like n=1 Tax=Phalaenopsis equestris TaxID=78828 RepID=UPI0009E440CE|nr:protein PLASTID MOVEMENT IMPAIRED 1-like [Phalaenopsis equestris]
MKSTIPLPQTHLPAMASNSMRRTSGGPELLPDLQSVNQSLSQPPISHRRNASLTLPTSNPSPHPPHLPLPQWQIPQHLQNSHLSPPLKQNRGIRNWKPIRMLTHIGMRRISSLFFVELIAIRNLPESMNGLRLSVHVRKRETGDGVARAMPSRVVHGCAEFNESLFIQCNVHCSGGGATGKPVKLESRPFLVSVVAVDAAELEFGRTMVDLSELIRESMEGSLAGARIRKWDAVMELSGKAGGGELGLRVGFQLMDDGGVGIYNRLDDMKRSKGKGLLNFSSGRGRRKSMNSFSVSTLDSRVKKMSFLDQSKVEDFDFPEFQIVEKGTEPLAGGEDGNGVEKTSGEVVKEVVHNRAEKQSRLMELDSIANEIRDLESMMSKNLIFTTNTAEKEEKEELDSSEETVTKEFLKMLDTEANSKQLKAEIFVEEDENQEIKALLPSLGNGLGPVIQTKDGGFMASMNPFNEEITGKEAPKLVLQISKPFVLRDLRLSSGLEVFRRLAAVGLEELCSRLTVMAAMDELQGKTAEKIAFEGIASAIISGRNKEGASSIAAKSIVAVRRMISAMGEENRKGTSFDENRSIKKDSILLEEILAFSIQRIEGMVLEALKIQADLAEEEGSFDVSPLTGTESSHQILDSAISIDEQERTFEENKRLTLLMIIQLRDPVRQYEAVGAPLIAVTQAIMADNDEEDEEETRYKVISIHVGGLKVGSGEKRTAWDGEKSRLTATQWLVGNGMGKMGKKSRTPKSKLQQDLLWSLSSRKMEDMWLSSVRNPDVKIA